MLEQIKQALRLFLLSGKDGHCQGGLLVLLWAEPGAANCAVAAAGSKWGRIQPETLKNVLIDLKFSCAGPIPEPDPQDLCAFTDMHGSLKLFLFFQVKDLRCFSPEWSAGIKDFLRVFSLANAGISVHLQCKFPQQTIQQEFRASFTRRITLAMKPARMLDVTCSSFTNKLVTKGRWCPGGHPVLGSNLPLSIPPETMDSGLYGELSMQLVTLLSPCVLQYPNLETLLTHMEVQAYTPSNVPITVPFAFFQNIPAHLDCRELGQRILHCPSYTDDNCGTVAYCYKFAFLHQAYGPPLKGPSCEGSIVYALEHETCRKPKKRFHLHPVKQKVLIFLFLQHTDPFASQLSDFMVTDALIERHLEDILINNRRAVTGVLQTELSNTLKAQDRRKRDQKKLLSAAEVILSASISIVSCSTNLNFRKACLSHMQVSDTHELAASLRDSLLRVMSWRSVPRKGCYSA